VKDTEALADDLAAHNHPELRDNLDAAYRRPFPGVESTSGERGRASVEMEQPRASDDDLPREVSEVLPELDTYEGPHGHTAELGRIPEEFRARFARVSRQVAAANNNLSLVFHDESGYLAVFGDAHSSVLEHALDGMNAEYAVVLAPHHGTYPVPASFPSANVCVAQAGSSHHERWIRHVDTHNQPRSCVSTAEIGSLSVW
jgi:hypothetical protein